MTREDIPVRKGYEYDSYFPRAQGGTITKKKGATVSDTIRFIPMVVYDTLFHTKRFANEVIKTDTLHKTCKNIWEFVFKHIAYKKDEDGKEQVRSPARVWHDRHNYQGVDCDCYTVFISSILTNLNIKHVLRITKYEEDHFQHIYPIVPIGIGKYITIDCVVKSFNYEEPYTEKKDTAMDLEYLNGVGDRNNNHDTEDLMGMMSEREAMTELGRLFKRRTAEQKQERRGKIKKFLNKGLHAANRFNPAAAAIRAGVLAAMKLNFMKIGGELKYTYLNDEEARKRGVRMDRFSKMKRIREKLEKIFYGAGGKPENLKKAILKGRGNRNKDVPLSGFDYVSSEQIDGLHEDMPLSQLLGADMFASESMHEVQGLGELGEPATAATIAAASTVLTTIVALIKKVGSLIPKKKPEANGDSSSHEGDGGGGGESESSGDNNRHDASNESGNTVEATSETSNKRDAPTTNNTASEETNSSAKENLPAVNKEKDDADTEDNNSNQRDSAKDSKQPSFWEKNKKWITPTGIAVATLGLITLAYQALKPKPVLNGVPKKNKSSTAYKKSKAKKGGHSAHSKVKHHHKKETVDLM